MRRPAGVIPDETPGRRAGALSGEEAIVSDTQASSTPAQTRRIVVGVDGSACSVAALDWAATQAELTGSVLDVLTTWEWPNSYGVLLVVPTGYDPEADARAVLEDVRQAVCDAHPGIVVRPIVVRGHPAPALVEASRGADLLVVGSRGHGEFTGMLLGSVSEHCVTNAHCPVLVLRGGG
jgi:nucleotide-binding universal stress UspA family protein